MARSWNGNQHTVIAREGSLFDCFDLDEIIEAYSRQDLKLDKAELTKFFSIPLITLFQDSFWVTPGTLAECVITGLGLGYPIESTVSFIRGYR